MLEHLNPNWKQFLEPEFSKPYFEQLIDFVEVAYENETCFPPKELIFNAFNSCSIGDLKVVIIGQDPYHGTNEANGLCFSVNDSVAIPPSLRNIFREIATDFDMLFLPQNGNLKHWANQGILLLNATLTVEKDKAGSHQKQGWETFTDAVIKLISEQKKEVVFLLWGNYAQKKGKNIDESKHLILKSGHPSPLSANQGKWFGNKHFSQTNDYLKSKGLNEIDW